MAGGVLALGAGAGGTLGGESRGGGEEAGGEAMSFGGAGGGEVASVGGILSSGVGGPEWTGSAAGSSVGGGEIGRGGSSFGGMDAGRGGAGSSGGSGDAGKGGAGDSGGGGEAGCGGAGSSGRGRCSLDSKLKLTHESLVSSPADEGCSGPKMLSKSAIEGFLVGASASVDTSASSAEGGPVDGAGGGTILGGSGGGVPVGKDLVKEDSGSDRGIPHASDSNTPTSVFDSPKAVSKGGPNKAVVSSENGVC